MFDERSDSYPPIESYGLIGDCHSVALVSSEGSIDWCTMPRLDSASCFGRLLDWKRGGYCQIRPRGTQWRAHRRYLNHTLILETRFRTASGEARLLDCFTMRPGGREAPHAQLLRIVEGVRGEIALEAEIVPRFAYGEMRPWIRRHGRGFFTAIGGASGLVLWSDLNFEEGDARNLCAHFKVSKGQRLRLSIRSEAPHHLYPAEPIPQDPNELDLRFERTLEWWKRWSAHAQGAGVDQAAIVRSAIVIKALTNAPTGAIAAAATTSLPESPGGERNWDYRFSWVRDSSFALRALASLGFHKEALRFRYFIERTTAGNVDDVRVLYGLGGEARLPELTLDFLDGYRGARPVRTGNAAYSQVQLDVYGELLDLAWNASQFGQSPAEPYWRFLIDVAEKVRRVWQEPDRGIWEVRGTPEHFVHSKVMCWVALDRALRLAERHGLAAPTEAWRQTRDEIRAAVEAEGYDRERGVFVRAFRGKALDASLLLLPRLGFVEFGDERMVRTVEAVRLELADERGLLRRYLARDGLPGDEGVFLACSFWLVDCLAELGRAREARVLFDRVCALSNDLGLFSEQYDVHAGAMLGNFPQGLTHYGHISAAVSIARNARS